MGQQSMELIDRYGKLLVNLAYTYRKDWSMSEDIVQEVFISAYMNLDEFNRQSSYKTWLLPSQSINRRIFFAS
ncbi:sigma factor [Rossellomorea sp. LjRoot5]|uniref:sigma factor n=1 Tax=Rossellomorea sp. LjRoot5 TaxID=3342331 RepID=UPI003ECCF049